MTTHIRPRRFEMQEGMRANLKIIGVLVIVLGAIGALTMDGDVPGGWVFRGVVFAFSTVGGIWVILSTRRWDRYGFEVGPLGFRSTTAGAEWRPWSAVDAVRVRRGEIVLLDERGKRLGGFSIGVEGFQQAVDDVLAACPTAVPVPVWPATFRGSSPWLGRSRARFGAVGSLVAAAGTLLAMTSRPGSALQVVAFVVTFAGLVAALAVPIRTMILQKRAAIVETTVDADGITIRDGYGERRIERDAVRDVRIDWGDRERRVPGYHVVVTDRGASPVRIAPPTVDAVELYAAVRAMRDGP